MRNLCYLVTKREKQKRQYFELNRQCFQKQVEYLNKYKSNTGAPECTPSPMNSFPSPSNTKQINNSAHSTSQRTTYRIRDILQIKNENCIYDFPEKWSFTQEAEKEPFIDIENTTQNEVEIKSDDTTNIAKIKTKHHVTKEICKKYRLMDRNRNKKSDDETIASPCLDNSFSCNSPKTNKVPSKPNIKDISINVLNNQKQSSSQVARKTLPIRLSSKKMTSPKPDGNQTKENNRQIRNEIIISDDKKNSLTSNI